MSSPVPKPSHASTTVRRILLSAVGVGGLSLLVNLAAMGKEILIAQEFGTSPAMDAATLAFAIVGFAISVWSGSIPSAFLPRFVQLQEQHGRSSAQRLLSGVTITTAVGLLGVVAILWLGLRPLLVVLAREFTPAIWDLTDSLLIVLFPTVLFAGIAYVWKAVLHSHGRLSLATVSPLVVHGCTAITLLLVAKDMGVHAIAWGAALGIVLELLLIGIGVRRHGWMLRPQWFGFTEELRAVGTQYAPLVVGGMVLGAAPLIDQIMATNLGANNVSTLRYALKMLAFPLGLAAVGLSTAFFPVFTRMVANKQWDKLRQLRRGYVHMIALLSIPVTIALLVAAPALIGVILERGAFDNTDTQQVAEVFRYYVLHLPFYLLGTATVRLLSSLEANRMLMWGTMITLPLNILLNVVFSRFLGVAGIALSTSCSYVVTLAFLEWKLHRILRHRSRL